jgi:hypothetical protein
MDFVLDQIVFIASALPFENKNEKESQKTL